MSTYGAVVLAHHGLRVTGTLGPRAKGEAERILSAAARRVLDEDLAADAKRRPA